MSTGYFGHREELYLDNLHWGLITASHILHKHGVFDAYGHVSVRNPDNLSAFFMSKNIAPALVQSEEDLNEYQVDNGEPLEDNGSGHFAERYIHSEIYKRFKSINSVVHCHASDVLPYCVTDTPLKPLIHTAGFLGQHVPLWDIRRFYGRFTGQEGRQDLLVKSADQGASLAESFGRADKLAHVYRSIKSALPAALGGQSAPVDDVIQPAHSVVLMRGHGFTTLAESIEAAVYQAIYTIEAAKVQTTAALIAKPKPKPPPKQQDSQPQEQNEPSFKDLSANELTGTKEFNLATNSRPWDLWIREVEVDPLYRNTVQRTKEESK